MDRFCEAMISIKNEIMICDKDEPNNVLKNAPHTMMMLTSNEWNFPYTREQAAYPLEWVADNKFWPTVRRADDAYGDRNLMCTCAPMEEYL
jgi:glycine dehydrogenase